MKKPSLIAGIALLLHATGVPVRAADEPIFKSADEITKQIAIEGRVSFSSRSLPFKLNSTELASDDAFRQLVEIAKALQSPQLAEKRFTLQGHTCDLGAEDYNLDLSKRRAAAVQAMLGKAGIPVERLRATGLGESQPAHPNNGEENRAKNRRVELKLLGS